MANMLGPTPVVPVAVADREVTELLTAEVNRRFMAVCNDTGATVWLSFGNTTPETTASIRSATYRWTASGSGTNEFYCELAAGGDPGLTEPNTMYLNSAYVAKGTLGSLAAGTWGWGDNDTLGYNTAYVRLTDGADPDSKAAGWVTAGYCKGAMMALADGMSWLEDVLGIHVCGVWGYQESGASVNLKTMKDY